MTFSDPGSGRQHSIPSLVRIRDGDRGHQFLRHDWLNNKKKGLLQASSRLLGQRVRGIGLIDSERPLLNLPMSNSYQNALAMAFFVLCAFVKVEAEFS